MHLKFLTIPQNHYEQYLINTLIRQRSQSKGTIFNNLIKRLIERKPIFQSQLICP